MPLRYRLAFVLLDFIVSMESYGHAMLNDVPVRDSEQPIAVA